MAEEKEKRNPISITTQLEDIGTSKIGIMAQAKELEEGKSLLAKMELKKVE
jgi:hypothetical protein